MLEWEVDGGIGACGPVDGGVVAVGFEDACECKGLINGCEKDRCADEFADPKVDYSAGVAGGDVLN